MARNQADRLLLYVEDAREQLELIESHLLLLEQARNPGDGDVLNEIFRGIHTIKGGADFLGLTNIKTLTHATEDVLQMVRDKRIGLSGDDVGTLLVVTDTLKEILEDCESSKQIDISALLEAVKAIALPGTDESVRFEQDDIPLGIPGSPTMFQLPRHQASQWNDASFDLFILEAQDVDRDEFERQLDEIGYVCDSVTTAWGDAFYLFRSVLGRRAIAEYLRFESGNSVDVYEAERLNSTAEDRVSADITSGTLIMDEDKTDSRTTTSSPSVQSTLSEEQRADSIRVHVDLLDSLMNLAGELVLTRNQLNQNVENWDRNAINLAAQRLDTVTTELQASIMSTRMQPISIVLDRFHRITRDMAHKLGKSVALELEGEDVELDKSIIEKMSDPLTHLVRNAIDHGIESIDERKGAGKPETGTICIKARHEAGHVLIEMADDGRGISVERVTEEAVRRGLVDRARAEELSERELVRYIFMPGFSTATQVSDISGRGVGMDVVSTNLSRLGGSIDVDTRTGEGTQFRIKLPLTLAIVPSLLVSVSSETYAIPQVNLVELVRLSPGHDEQIEFVGDSAVLRLRGELLPVIWLAEFLGTDSMTREADERASVVRDDTDTVVLFTGLRNSSSRQMRECTNVVVVAAGDFHYGIIVDNLTDSEEIVVKPLGAHLRNCSGYAGATILGDGRSALILDVGGIAEEASLRDRREDGTTADAVHAVVHDGTGDEEKLLVVENAPDEFFAIQLAYVSRIERIDTSAIQAVGDRNVVKYGGNVLRVFEINEGLNAGARQDTGLVYLIIFHILGVEVAVAVSTVVDIVDAGHQIDRDTFRQSGVWGSTILMDKIVLLLDLAALVKTIDPSMAGTIQGVNSGPEDSTRTVLVVEDSLFFQDKLTELLESMDVNVIVAADGRDGWDCVDRCGDDIDLILMDVEMPHMSGLELTRMIRGDRRFEQLPVVMLTSLAKESDMERGKAAGADDYLVKMDQEMVKRTVQKHFARQVRKVA